MMIQEDDKCQWKILERVYVQESMKCTCESESSWRSAEINTTAAAGLSRIAFESVGN